MVILLKLFAALAALWVVAIVVCGYLDARTDAPEYRAAREAEQREWRAVQRRRELNVWLRNNRRVK